MKVLVAVVTAIATITAKGIARKIAAVVVR